jgi:hypothetical protein
MLASLVRVGARLVDARPFVHVYVCECAMYLRAWPLSVWAFMCVSSLAVWFSVYSRLHITTMAWVFA